jgi:hypothetical protein
MPQPRNSSALLVSLLVLCLGCGDTAAPLPQSPPSTPAPTAESGYIWGFVIGAGGSGACVRGGVVEIVDGPGTGRKSAQADGCGAWDYSGGYEFRNLPMGATVTLRATAPGYEPQDRELVVQNGGPGVEFDLTPK